MYNLAIDDTDMMVILLKKPQISILVSHTLQANGSGEKDLSYNFRQMVRDFYRVAFRIASDHEVNFLVPE